MSDEASIVSEPGNRPEEVNSTLLNRENTKLSSGPAQDGFEMNEIPELSCKEMASGTLENYVVKALEISQLPRTQENLDKIVMNLSKQMNKWMLGSDFIMQDVTKQEFANHWLEEACRVRSLPNNTESWRKIIKERS